MPAVKPKPIPKQLAACADELYSTREARLALQKQVEALEEREKALKAHLIENLPKSLASGVAGKLARATVVSKEVPQVEDWDKLHKHILKTKDFSFLQRRLADGVIKEIWEDGKQVPGVKAFNAVTVSLSKV